MLEIEFDVFVYDIIKLFMKEYNDKDTYMEEGAFSFEFVGSISIRCDKVNVPKDSSYKKLPKWFRYKNEAINPKKCW